MLVLIVTSIVVVLLFLESSIKEPQKPEKVPDSAIWYGGPDGSESNRLLLCFLLPHGELLVTLL